MPVNKRGFTLIELLVVIAIIAILTAILFPVFTSVKEKGVQTSCISNEKQIHASLMIYASNYNEVLPMALTLSSDMFATYLKSWKVLSCPAQPIVMRNMEIRTLSTAQKHYYTCTYAMTTDVMNTEDTAPMSKTFNRVPTRLTEITHSKAILLMDHMILPPKTWGGWQIYPVGNPDWATLPADAADGLNGKGSYLYTSASTMRHNGGANCVYVDGHATWIKKGNFTASMFSKKRK